MIRNLSNIDERRIVKVYLIILMTVFILFSIFEIIFDFQVPTWIAFLSPFIFIIPLICMFLGMQIKYVLTINILLIIAVLQLVIMNNPKYYHVIVYWIGIIPILIVSLVKTNAARIWAGVFLTMILINGLIISSTIGNYGIEVDPIKFMAAGIIFWLVTYITLRLFNFIQERYKNQLRNSNKELSELKLEIETQNSLLKEQHEEIININEELKSTNDHLEERIQERTKDLEIKNEQLTEYAFINSHILRAPVARIVGLINLIKALEIHEKDKEVINHLDISGQELDEVVGRINKALDADTSLHRKHLNSH